MSDCSQYGKYYWCIKSDLSESGDIYVHADSLEVTSFNVMLCDGKDVVTVGC